MESGHNVSSIRYWANIPRSSIPKSKFRKCTLNTKINRHQTDRHSFNEFEILFGIASYNKKWGYFKIFWLSFIPLLCRA